MTIFLLFVLCLFFVVVTFSSYTLISKQKFLLELTKNELWSLLREHERELDTGRHVSGLQAQTAIRLTILLKAIVAETGPMESDGCICKKPHQQPPPEPVIETVPEPVSAEAEGG